MEQKYIKYKLKYLNYKNKSGGVISNMCQARDLKENIDVNFLITFSYGFIWNSNKKKGYLIYTNYGDNTYKLLDIGTDDPSRIRKLLKFENNKWKITLYDNHDRYPLYEFKNYNGPRMNGSYNVNNRKIVIFIRHGQSTVNLNKKYNEYYDPDLSDEGKRQARNLSNKLINFHNFLINSRNDNNSFFYNYSNGIELAIVSPLRRTLKTALPTLNAIQIKNVRESFLCTEQVKVLSDTGNYNNVDEFSRYYTEKFRTIDINKDEYNNYKSLWTNFQRNKKKENDSDMQNRTTAFKNYINSRTEKVIIVFTHRYFIINYLKYQLDMTAIPEADMINTSFVPIFHQ